MIRKTFMGMALLGLGAYLWMGTSLGSYAKTAYHEVRGYFSGQIPVEFEIKRARQLAGEVVPEIHSTKRSILNEEVKLTRLRQEIAQVEKNLEGEKVAILSLRQQLSKGLTSYKIGAETYSAQAVQNELNRRFNSFKNVDEILQSKREVLTSREAALLAAKEKHDKLVEGKQRLEAELAALEAKFKMLEVKKMANKFTIDDSQLTQVRSLMADINDRLEVEAKLSEEEGNLVKRIPAEDIPPADLGEQIDSYFAPATARTSGTPL